MTTIHLLCLRDICEQLLHMLQPNKTNATNGPRKVLDAPIHLASMTTANTETEELKSIWMQTRDDSLVRRTLNFIIRVSKRRHNNDFGSIIILLCTCCRYIFILPL